MRLLRV